MTLIIALCLTPLTFLTICFAIEVFAGLRPLRVATSGVPLTGDTTIIVPAHDEEAIIAAGLEELRIAAAENAMILVVADNCADRTAEIARCVGVEVIERFDGSHRGKGFALDFARQHLRASPPEVVVIIDADCRIDPESLRLLVGECVRTKKPCQATYILSPDPNHAPTVQLSSFAFFVKNVVRQRGLGRLGGRVHLLGTGMALPWNIFTAVHLATSNIVEDLELGLELSRLGHHPISVEGSNIWSFAASETNTLEQRRRWEGGYLTCAKKWAVQLLLESVHRRQPAEFWGAVNLMIPPFGLLLLLDLIAVSVGGGVDLAFGAYWWPPISLAAAMFIALAAVISAWFAGGYRFVSGRTFIAVPLYLVWKFAIYIGFLRSGAPRDWVRTRRE